MILQSAPTLWVKVERPTLDLVGIVLGSLGIAGLCALGALVLGIVLGITVIVRHRRHPPLTVAERSLQLLDGRRV